MTAECSADQNDHDTESEAGGPSRRAVLARVAVGTGALWVAPSIVSVGPSAFAAVGSGAPGRTFTIDATTAGSGGVFAASGISVVSGQTYTITVTGSASPGTGSYGPDGQPNTAGDPGGYNGGIYEVVDSTFNYFAVIARVGDGPNFPVGSSTNYTATADGALFFAYNDSKGYFDDNNGTFLATVTP